MDGTKLPTKEEVIAHIQSLNSKLSKSQDECKTLQRELTSVRSECTEAKEKFAELKQQSAEMQEQLNKAQGQTESHPPSHQSNAGDQNALATEVKKQLAELLRKNAALLSLAQNIPTKVFQPEDKDNVTTAEIKKQLAEALQKTTAQSGSDVPEEEARIIKLLEEAKIGDSTPSQCLRRLRDLADPDTFPDKLLKSVWLKQLPQQIQGVLKVLSETPLDELAEMADQMLETFPFSRPSVFAKAALGDGPEGASAEVLIKLLDKMERLETKLLDGILRKEFIIIS